MIWRKIQNLRLWEEGALNGLMLGLIAILPFAFLCVFFGCGQNNHSSEAGFSVVCMCDTVKWWFPLESLVLTTIASFLVQITFARWIKSNVLLWQIIGLVTVIVLYFYSPIRGFVREWRECVSYNWEASFCENLGIGHFFQGFIEPLQSSAFIQLATALAIFAAYNLVFALIFKYLKAKFAIIRLL